jgi:hypothetical protein
MNKQFYLIFHVCIFIALIQSLYILISNVHSKNYEYINSWQFPMLLAILIESINR